jgi:hypothetical protein
MSRTALGVHHIILRVHTIHFQILLILHVLCLNINRLIVSELPIIVRDGVLELRILAPIDPFISETCFAGFLGLDSMLSIVEVQSELVANFQYGCCTLLGSLEGLAYNVGIKIILEISLEAAFPGVSAYMPNIAFGDLLVSCTA